MKVILLISITSVDRIILDMQKYLLKIPSPSCCYYWASFSTFWPSPSCCYFRYLLLNHSQKIFWSKNLILIPFRFQGAEDDETSIEMKNYVILPAKKKGIKTFFYLLTQCLIGICGWWYRPDQEQNSWLGRVIDTNFSNNNEQSKRQFFSSKLSSSYRSFNKKLKSYIT